MRHTLPLYLLLPLLLGGCISNPFKTGDPPSQTTGQTAQVSAEDRILDLWVEVFDPGELPEDEDEARGLSMDIRKAEARYIPIHLARTIENGGHWGAVRVAPRETEGFEVLVRGRILHSDGERLRLSVTALDARGESWFQREYEHRIEGDYPRTGRDEAFQPLYDQIADDLVERRNEYRPKELRRIRRIAELRFARSMAPEAFEDYLEQSKDSENDGRFRLRRLPAESDPGMQWVRAIRDRDHLLMDTLNGHFDHYYRNMDAPYADWRRARAEEARLLREIEEKALTNKLLGGLAILGGIALAAAGADDGPATRSVTGNVGQLMIMGGAWSMKSGFDKDAESSIHKAALEELGDSFRSEAQPLVVQVEGETYRLTGSAESQYAQWRNLLKRIYAEENVLPSRAD